MRKGFVLTVILFTSFFSNACNLSYASVDSIVMSGPNYSIYINACFGGGILGTTSGADGRTSSFAFSLYSATPISVLAFSPSSITGDSTGCTMPGLLAGPGLGANENVFYSDPGCPTGYTCVTSTAACGEPHSDCKQFVITTDVLPDSIRLHGAEGSGNPFGGCFPNSDMLIDFAIVLSVDWGNINAVAIDERTRRISWETYSEQNNDYFEVQRWLSGTHHWEVIKKVDGAGNSNSPRFYEYLDEIFLLGKEAYYRIKQVDFDGSYQYSKMMSIASLPDDSPISLHPNPAKDEVRISGVDVNETNVCLVSSTGEVFPVQLQPSASIQTSHLSSGVYFVHVIDGEETTVLKLVVL